MKIIADSGATKTTWFFVQNGEIIKQVASPGISPYFMESETISQIIQDHLVSFSIEIEEIHYYGTGCNNEKNNQKIQNILEAHFPKTEKIEINSDLLAAARALCKNEKGIACILGTGSNSCYFDGETIIKNLKGYGYILGDFGSGAAIGKQLVLDFLTHKMPSKLKSQMAEVYQLDEQKVMAEVYQSQMPSKFLASFARFAYDNKNEDYIVQLIQNQLDLFVELMILPYQLHDSLAVHFTGSVAFGFQEFIKEIAKKKGIQMGLFLKEPMQGLVEFHNKKP